VLIIKLFRLALLGDDKKEFPEIIDLQKITQLYFRLARKSNESMILFLNHLYPDVECDEQAFINSGYHSRNTIFETLLLIFPNVYKLLCDKLNTSDNLDNTEYVYKLLGKIIENMSDDEDEDEEYEYDDSENENENKFI
jgi:hypothetical protein